MPILNARIEACLEVMHEAASRWKDRQPERAAAERKLRLGGPSAADEAGAVKNFTERRVLMAQRAASGAHDANFRFERIIDGVDFSDRPGSAAEERAGRAIARLCELRSDGNHVGFGTGFMIAPGLLITNHHVFRTASETRGCGAQFGFERQRGATVPGETFELDASRFFVADKNLDFAIVAVRPRSLEDTSLSRWGYHKLIQETGKILIGHPISIIQHPGGGTKKFASTNNFIVDRLERYLHYTTDTERGSSGSAGFNSAWEVVVLHHSGVPEIIDGKVMNLDGKPWSEDQGINAVRWVANEGVRVSRILTRLAEMAGDGSTNLSHQSLLQSILNAEENLATSLVAKDRIDGAITDPMASGRTVASGALVPGCPVIHVHGSSTINVNQAPVHEGVYSSPAILESRSLQAFEKTFRRDPDYGRRIGFDSHFLQGYDIELPSIDQSRHREMVVSRRRNRLILDYHHFSLEMNRSWLLQMWSAVNVNYDPDLRRGLTSKDFGSSSWISDPRISDVLQIEDEELYAPAEKFDRGHMVRRDDNAWGHTREEIEFANSDTYHWTNCAPQHEDFNRAIFGKKGVWGKLENHIAREADDVGDKLNLFSGPVLDADRAIPKDFGGGLFRVPLDFWKVVVVAERTSRRRRTRLRAFGFLMEQESAIDRFGLESLPNGERFNVGKFTPQQRPLAELTRRTGVNFPDNVLDADVLKGANGDEALRPLETLRDVKL